MKKITLDTSVLVGLLNPRDLWHPKAVALENQLVSDGDELIYFDCVLAETISTITRRLHEKNRVTEIASMVDALDARLPKENITWIFPDVQRLYPRIMELVRMTQGVLNFNDALIALACQERSIEYVASFDADFDRIAWLQRISVVRE